MSVVERAIEAISPRWAFRRRQWRSLLAWYDGAQRSRYRRLITADPDPNMAVQRDRKTLRAIARDLERNNDLARGILNVMVANVVGRGIGVEPQPLRPDGEVDDRVAATLRDLWREWAASPDVSGRCDLGLAQRLLARAWLRDGEVFAQHLFRSRSRDSVRVPYALELIEADWLSDLSDGNRLFDGIEVDEWRRPIAYHFYRRVPPGTTRLDTRRVDADRISHLALTDHLGQLRGVSVFASVVTRLQDLRDYEESERVAAKIAAAMTAMIRKGGPDMYEAPTSDDGEVREITFRPGQIFDDLRPGESVDVIDTKRPNTALADFRSAMMRAVAAGVGAGFSSIARQYDGTYSAQRQELVEQWSQYAALSDQFACQFLRPVYRNFVRAAVASGAARLPSGMSVEAAAHAAFIPPAIPWIDPEKEATAWRLLDESGYASPQEIIRRRGLDPEEVRRQRREWQRTGSTDDQTRGRNADRAA